MTATLCSSPVRATPSGLDRISWTSALRRSVAADICSLMSLRREKSLATSVSLCGIASGITLPSLVVVVAVGVPAAGGVGVVVVACIYELYVVGADQVTTYGCTIIDRVLPADW